MQPLTLNFHVTTEDFSLAGQASSTVKHTLKDLGFSPDIVRRTAIAMYEAEINMVIHANGGTITVTITPEEICAIFADVGPGIPDIPLAMQEGYSTATEDVRDLGFGAGMGLPNIKKFTDQLDIQTKLGVGTTVTMKIFIQ
jgi:serine/threonine-protein kinase RsbT